MTNEEAKVFLDNLKICINEHPVVADWLVEIANRKTENSSEKPNNCEWSVEYAKEMLDTMPCEECGHWEHGAGDHYYCALLEMRQKCYFELKGESTLMFANKPKDEPQTILEAVLDRQSDEDRRKMAESVRKAIKDEAQTDMAEDIVRSYGFKAESYQQAKAKDEPQTDCGDFADRLAYERGVKHAWKVAQKVFDSTVTFYEAEDVAKQIDKDINVRSKTEPKTQTETQNSNLTFEKDECAKEYEELGLKELKELIEADRKTESNSEKPNNSTISKMEQVEDEPQTNHLVKTPSKSRDGHEIADAPLTDAEITELAKEIVHKMIDNSVIAEDAYPGLRQRMHEAVERLGEYYYSEDERSK